MQCFVFKSFLGGALLLSTVTAAFAQPPPPPPHYGHYYYHGRYYGYPPAHATVWVRGRSQPYQGGWHQIADPYPEIKSQWSACSTQTCYEKVRVVVRGCQRDRQLYMYYYDRGHLKEKYVTQKEKIC